MSNARLAHERKRRSLGAAGLGLRDKIEQQYGKARRSWVMSWSPPIETVLAVAAVEFGGCGDSTIKIDREANLSMP